MVVDDMHTNIEVVSMMIGISFYFKPIEAENGKVSVEKFKDNFMNPKGCTSSTCMKPKIKLILMDINMPVMDGLSATKEIY